MKTGRAGSCRVQLKRKRNITLWLAGNRCARTVAIPAKTNGLTNAGRTVTEVNSLDETQNSASAGISEKGELKYLYVDSRYVTGLGVAQIPKQQGRRN